MITDKQNCVTISSGKNIHLQLDKAILNELCEVGAIEGKHQYPFKPNI